MLCGGFMCCYVFSCVFFLEGEFSKFTSSEYLFLVSPLPGQKFSI